MVNRRASDATAQPAPIAPVVKRKRRASCLGEQERRERKRAIDREAQRSLREKTKTHIAELERTIQILRNQDGNGSTASLLSEIDSLRQENERLRDVIDSVKSVVGSEIFPRSISGGSSAGNSARSNSGSPDASGDGALAQSPKPRTNSMSQVDYKPSLPTPSSVVGDPMSSHFDSMNFGHHMPTASGAMDLDGMTVMSGTAQLTPDLGLNLGLEPVFEITEGDNMVDARAGPDRPDSPSTAAFAPFIDEIFGPTWRCPSSVVLHIGDAPQDSSAAPAGNNALCPIWKQSNELLGKVFTYRPGMTTLNREIEAGLLFLGFKQGWDTFNEWIQSPALKILKEVDELLFCNLPKMRRLATA